MRSRRSCAKGHTFWKSTDCPTCPVCEAARKPAAAFMEGLSAPARRALERAGLTTVAKLARMTEREVLELHGMGPASMPKLRAALKKDGRKFSEDRDGENSEQDEAYQGECGGLPREAF